MKATTYQQLIERAALTALELFQAQTTKKALKAELRSLYDTYFEAYGRPNGKFDPCSEAFLPVDASCTSGARFVRLASSRFSAISLFFKAVA